MVIFRRKGQRWLITKREFILLSGALNLDHKSSWRAAVMWIGSESIMSPRFIHPSSLNLSLKFTPPPLSISGSYQLCSSLNLSIARFVWKRIGDNIPIGWECPNEETWFVSFAGLLKYATHVITLWWYLSRLNQHNRFYFDWR